jgi:beta-lactamase class A
MRSDIMRGRTALGPLIGAMLALHAIAPATRVEAQSATRSDAGLERLEAQIASLAKVSRGTVGVAIVHLETGRSVYLNRTESFPMASTYKVPIAAQLLSRVDRGEVRLDSMVTLRPGDLHPGSGTLTELFNQPGVALSVRNLLELTLRISDNSATDLVLRTAGGAPAVNARLQALGVRGISVDRPTIRLIADYIGIADLPSDTVPPDQFRALARAVPDSMPLIAARAAEGDPRDAATPEGMALLLEKIWRGQAMSQGSTELLIDIMRRCMTGADRLKGMLPPGTTVAHKTGTLGAGGGVRGVGTQNDVGVIELPGDAGHLITVVMVKGEEQAARGERTIAHIARAAYDYFVTNPSVTSARPVEAKK